LAQTAGKENPPRGKRGYFLPALPATRRGRKKKDESSMKREKKGNSRFLAEFRRKKGKEGCPTGEKKKKKELQFHILPPRKEGRILLLPIGKGGKKRKRLDASLNPQCPLTRKKKRGKKTQI